MNDASSDAVCKCAVFAFTETSRTLLAIPLRFALTPEDRFTYPAISPLPGLDLFFIGLLHHYTALLIRKFTRFREPRYPRGLQRVAGRSGDLYPGPKDPPRHGPGLGRITSLAPELCSTCYTLKRQDEEYFGGLC